MPQGVENSYDERPSRPCMSCMQHDKAPRDSVGLPDGNVAYYHKDCHAALGCSVCQEELDTVAGGIGPKGKKNEDLWNAIVENSDLNPETPTKKFYTRVDTSGSYQEAITAGDIVDTNWEGEK